MAENPKDFSHTHKVWIDFATGESHGIKLCFPDSMLKPEIGGKRCAGTNISNEEQYIYFDIDDSFIYDGNYPVVDVTIEYYDEGKDALNIHFDCKENFYSDNIYAWRGKVISKTNSNRWKRFTAHLADAKFANRQKHHRLPLTEKADMRIHNRFDGSEEYISFLEVKIPYLYISTNVAGNIFKPNHSVSLQIKGLNRELREKTFDLLYKIKGYNGNIIEQKTLDFNVPKNSILERKIDFTPKDKGIYFASFLLKEGGNIIETAETSFAVCDETGIDATDRYNSPFGICVGYEDLLNEDLVNLLRDTGIGWVRFEPVWEHLEAEKGKFRWEPYDRMIEIASERGLALYGLLGYQTGWADPTTGSEEAIGAFANYAYKLTERYKDKIKFWEVWNEEDWMGFWQPEANPDIYTELLKKVYMGIKKASPESKVILGGLTGNYKARGYYKFLDMVYKNEGKSYFDIVAIHPYTAPIPPEEGNKLYSLIQDAVNRMHKFGDADKKIWFTEIGWPTGMGGIEEHISNEANVEYDKQAEYLIRAHIIGLSSSAVNKIFWYCFKNSGYDAEISEQNFGLTNADFSPKPSYVAYRVLISKITGLKYIGRMDLETPLMGYIFGNRDKKVKVLWSTREETVLNLNINGEIALLTDIMGNTEQIKVKGGKVRLILSESPVFLEEKNAFLHK